MNSWPRIKGRPQPATLANTKGRWVLAWGQVLHMATEPGTSHADGACRALVASAPHSCIRESTDLRQTRPAACAAGSEPAEVILQSDSEIGARCSRRTWPRTPLSQR
ncbi:unnamed protein product [Pleuronectes platessa]|uniref:Uncharacterized protein n=1 Tax=Pleuronectes platessa TaxID=8262 RepID=A0A9N7VFR4_PLEPL|nr:unnamed protein product [Pleuronectes platessa]